MLKPILTVVQTIDNTPTHGGRSRFGRVAFTANPWAMRALGSMVGAAVLVMPAAVSRDTPAERLWLATALALQEGLEVLVVTTGADHPTITVTPESWHPFVQREGIAFTVQPVETMLGTAKLSTVLRGVAIETFVGGALAAALLAGQPVPAPVEEC